MEDLILIWVVGGTCGFGLERPLNAERIPESSLKNSEEQSVGSVHGDPENLSIACIGGGGGVGASGGGGGGGDGLPHGTVCTLGVVTPST